MSTRKKNLEPSMVGKVVTLRVDGSSQTTRITGRLLSYSTTGYDCAVRLEGEDIPRRFRSNHLTEVLVEDSE